MEGLGLDEHCIVFGENDTLKIKGHLYAKSGWCIVRREDGSTEHFNKDKVLRIISGPTTPPPYGIKSE